MSSRKRIVGYDVLKCVSFYLVFFLHFRYFSGGRVAPGVAHDLVYHLTLVGVPLMLMVNGALLFSRPFDLTKHRQKVINLALKVSAWRLISIVLYGALVGISPLGQGRAAFVDALLGTELQGFNLGHFWFMYALLCIYMVFPALRLAYEHPQGRQALLFLLVFLVGVGPGFRLAQDISNYAAGATSLTAVSFLSFRRYTIYQEYGNALLYFLLGGLLSDKLDKDAAWREARLPYAAVGIAAFSAYALGSRMGLLSRWYEQPCNLVLCCCLFALVRRVEIKNERSRALVTDIGSNTLGMYMLHMFILRIAQSCFDAASVGAFVFPVSLAVVLVLYLLSWLASRFARRVPYLGWLFGM